MSIQAPLFAPPQVAPSPRRRYLAGIDPRDAMFVRTAAARISAYMTATDIDAALAEVPAEHRQFVETLTVSGLALRVARALHPRLKDALLAEVPEYLVARVEPLARSYAQIRPWERRKGDE